MSAYTPGPWRTDEDLYFVMAGGTNVVAHCNRTGLRAVENQANAQLIAAAPDLLEALDLLLFAYPHEHSPNCGAIDPDKCCAPARARAALVKAVGK